VRRRSTADGSPVGIDATAYQEMDNSVSCLGLNGIDSHDDPRVVRAWRWLHWILVALSMLAIPAFYVELTAGAPALIATARMLYVCIFAGFTASFAWLLTLSRKPKQVVLRNRFDILIVLGAAASAGWGATPWSSLEWVLRMAFMCIVATRIVLSLRNVLASNRLLLLLATGVAVLALGGAGFYWLEPRVHSYAEGVWLAFESSATVGYGDIAPTTPASRVLAAFVVLLGYGMLSLVFASIAAIFVGQEEKLLRREMHRDIKRLHEEIAVLHREMQGLRGSLPDRGDAAAAKTHHPAGE
jgi:voltage-gated potassium channel